jgi:hypothetical protein
MRQQWLRAVADNSDGLDPDPVFDRLEQKIQRGSKSADQVSPDDKAGSPES